MGSSRAKRPGFVETNERDPEKLGDDAGRRRRTRASEEMRALCLSVRARRRKRDSAARLSARRRRTGKNARRVQIARTARRRARVADRRRRERAGARGDDDDENENDATAGERFAFRRALGVRGGRDRRETLVETQARARAQEGGIGATSVRGDVTGRRRRTLLREQRASISPCDALPFAAAAAAAADERRTGSLNPPGLSRGRRKARASEGVPKRRLAVPVRGPAEPVAARGRRQDDAELKARPPRPRGGAPRRNRRRGAAPRHTRPRFC